MKNPIKTYKFIIKTHSPIHIGCGETYEPTGFSINDINKCLVVFDPLFFISNLNEDDLDSFSKICQKGTVESIQEIYKFMHNRPIEGRNIELCNGFINHFNDVLKYPYNKFSKNFNKFQIERTSYCKYSQRPYIPGSSVKGALRTAYLSLTADKSQDYKSFIKNYPNKKRLPDELERKLLKIDKEKNPIIKDPFKQIKVSDFMPVGNAVTKVLYAVNKKKRDNEKNARGIPHILEIIQPESLFSGEITIMQQEKESVSFPISLNELIKCSNLFYQKENNREINECKEIGADYNVFNNIDKITPVRIGRHSGAESITIEKYRDIKIMRSKQQKPVWLAHSTTLWLSSDEKKGLHMNKLQPFGWASLRQISDDESYEFERLELEYQDELHNIYLLKQKKKQEMLQRQKEAEKKRLEKIRIEKEREKEEQEEKLRFEAMSEEDKQLYEFTNPNLAQERVVQLFNNIDDYSDNYKKELALKIKEYWQREKQWNKKDFSKKAWKNKFRDRVQKIKDILGE